MNFKTLFRLIIAVIALFTIAPASMSQQSASLSRVKHKVERGETLYGISHRYNVSPDSIVAYNPSVRSGLKTGQIITIPGVIVAPTAVAGTDETPGWRSANRTATTQPATTTAPTEVAEHQDYQPGFEDPTRQLDPIDSNAEQSGVAEGDEIVAERELLIAIIQPFMLDSKATRQAQLTTDFYRGFLLAADTLNMLLPKTKFLVYDTRNSTERLRNYLSLEKQLLEADIIIAPNNAEHLNILAEYGRENHVPVLNSFVVHDVQYQTNPYLLSGNIPSIDMTSVASEQLVEMCKNEHLVPVILKSTKNTDKESFCNDITEALSYAGITAKSIEYTDALTTDDLDILSGEQANYVFIPNSASLTEFNRIAYALNKYKTEKSGELTVRLFGYPEWVTFKTDNKEQMHAIETYIYSRFNPDTEVYNARDVANSFNHWYKCNPMDGVPSQALWGFDTGCFVLNNLANGYSFRPEGNLPSSWNGVQSTFSFQRIGSGSGAINNAMYIIGYLPGGIIDARVVE